MEQPQLLYMLKWEHQRKLQKWHRLGQFSVSIILSEDKRFYSKKQLKRDSFQAKHLQSYS